MQRRTVKHAATIVSASTWRVAALCPHVPKVAGRAGPHAMVSPGKSGHGYADAYDVPRLPDIPDSVPSIPHTTLADAGAALAARPYAQRGIAVPQREIRIVLADDHTIFRSALKELLHRAAPEVTVVGEASGGDEAVELVRRLRPEIIVMDLEMPRGDGLTATRILVDSDLAVRVLILTMHTEEERLMPLLRAGARGYLAKDVAERELVDAIRAVAAGDIYVQPKVARLLAASSTLPDELSTSPRNQFATLSEREQTVLHLVAEGFNGPEIGVQLGISAKTVDTYKQRIQDKVGLSHRTEYVRFAIDAGLLDH